MAMSREEIHLRQLSHFLNNKPQQLSQQFYQTQPQTHTSQQTQTQPQTHTSQLSQLPKQPQIQLPQQPSQPINYISKSPEFLSKLRKKLTTVVDNFEIKQDDIPEDKIATNPIILSLGLSRFIYINQPCLDTNLFCIVTHMFEDNYNIKEIKSYKDLIVEIRDSVKHVNSIFELCNTDCDLPA